MKVKVIKCHDSRLWYARYIGEVFQVRRIDTDVYWVRPEDDPYAGWNWISFLDCVEYKEVS